MHPGLLDMLHHPGHEDLVAIAKRVDIHLGGAAQILIDQDGARAGDLHGGADVAIELLVVADDLHGPPAEYIGRADDHRIADLVRPGEGLLGAAGDGVDRLGDIQPVQQLLERRSRSSARSMASGEGPLMGTRASSSAWASFKGVWPPN